MLTYSASVSALVGALTQVNWFRLLFRPSTWPLVPLFVVFSKLLLIAEFTIMLAAIFCAAMFVLLVHTAGNPAVPLLLVMLLVGQLV